MARKGRPWRSMGKGLVLGGLLTSFLMMVYSLSMSPFRFHQQESCANQPTETQAWTSYNTSQHASEQGRSCTPKLNVMFMKTHKTASSTLLNILFRFGEKHHLKFAFPDNRNDFFYPAFFQRMQVKGYQPGMCFNIMCNHMRFNEGEVRSLLPADAAYITILRDPAELFESAFHYFNRVVPLTWVIPSKNKLAEFLRDPKQYYSPSSYNSYYLKNLLFFDLGYDNTLEPEDPQVEQAIQAMDKRFQLVMIAEHFEESLILLKDILCWQMEDLLFLRLNMRRGSSVFRLTPEQRMRAREWNAVDWRLYRRFNTTFWAKVEAYGRERMARDVEELRRQNSAMAAICVEGGQPVEAGQIRDAALQPWHPFGERSIMGYNLREDIELQYRELCRKMLTPEIQYMSELGVNLWITKLWGHVTDLLSW
ncbi:galactosylceramide sulfotransferase-like [Scleropages formosus]|uniref:Galactose-3-O-sulfotransferase 1 n=1 Tax=Scleropages formosus TaxID=113540 RepID=A0A8C9TI10_SCLFO|nr:galactosylceramide sulfotransferase-like [Scleropages formosus]XP_018605095.1 galactosylceramide sulfotransferase-like [Scleropages formosus]